VLAMSTLKFRDPVTISIDMVADDLSFHIYVTAVEGEGAEWGDVISAWCGDIRPSARVTNA
jgi:hypothetical protein